MAGEAISKSFPPNPTQESNPPIIKKKRNQPGNPDPQAEVIALSPKTLLATNRFVCEICGKGFQRDQNLQLHRRGHNLPWKLRQRSTKEPRKRVYVCPEKTCIHHHPSRALGDLTGIKKHFCRKHGEKKWKCDKCSKRYAVQSDWKAHSKTCGTREYRCDCGTIFSRRDSFITHRAFCDALAEETARVSAASNISSLTSNSNANYQFTSGLMRSNMVQHFPAMFNPAAAEGQVGDHATPGLPLWIHHGEVLSTDSSLSSMHQTGPVSIETLHGDPFASCSNGGHQLNRQLSWIYGNDLASSSSGELITSTSSLIPTSLKEADLVSVPSWFSTRHHQQHSMPASGMSATALLQKAAQIGVTSSSPSFFGGVEMKRHNTHVQDGSEYNGLLNPSHPGVAANMAGSLESTANPYNNMYSTRHQLAQKDGGGGATRDFLGVGVQTICPSSVNGWI
ncbi:zinc finger protein MAGPIE-like [Elaeis guineensis]|uniref:Protein EARLY HEADING DATE 2 n=1 Tax=Elaeis guineensis var. tenera TaxID=51953 RepID=A0A6I9R3U6_ELAGV|nr:zinc finger protein MAGPIE-like [Elaeis guineensis]